MPDELKKSEDERAHARGQRRTELLHDRDLGPKDQDNFLMLIFSSSWFIFRRPDPDLGFVPRSQDNKNGLPPEQIP